MKLLLAAFLLAPVPSRAADGAAAAATADATTLQVVEVVLKTPTPDVDPRLIDPFLAVKVETLPKKLRNKTTAKQVELTALLRIHDVKKKGVLVQPPTADNCSEKDFVKPLEMAGFFAGPGYEEVTEDELKSVMDSTKCTEIDLGCRFSMLIFFQKKKDRIIKFNSSDPIMAKIAEGRSSKGGSTHFFGMGYTCMH